MKKSLEKLKDTPQRDQNFPDDKFEEILDNITLNTPRNPFTLFWLSEAEKLKGKNGGNKIDFIKYNRICSDAWRELDEKNKQKFYKM